MQLKNIILLISCSFFIPSLLWGQEISLASGQEKAFVPGQEKAFPTEQETGLTAGQEMTLEQCREMALENNKAISIASRNKEQAEYTVKAYRANFFPKISASGNYLYYDTEMNSSLPGGYLPTFVPDPATGELIPNILTGPDGNPVIGADGNPIFNQYAYFPDMGISMNVKNTWMAGLRAEQPLYTGGKITSAYRMAQIGDKIAGLSEQLSRAEVIVKVDEAYWTYVKTRELVNLALSYQRVVTELLRDVRNAHEVGLKHQNDVLKVQVKVNEAELQLRQAENGNRLARKNLCYVTGLPLDREISLPASFDQSVGLKTESMDDYTSRPEYAILEHQIQLKEQEIKLTRSDFLPKVGVAANYGYINGLELNGYKLLEGASFSAMVSVNIPLFQWGEGRNKIRAAEAGRSIVQLQREDISRQMELELAQAFDKWDESVLDVQLTARSLNQAQENMRVSEDRYKAGMETLADYLEAQTGWQRAWTEHVNALTRLRLNQTYYLKAAGKL
ncbi:TolC family protein [uncultured Proteiniphilum sp.]|uniref:TolC family protein n=1 Tax=uncultured Proteiniphilum sp. TaxID=497637 RepID=UPI00261AF486|nr:TolC family protein [uncultured Proteiniphilum sp.]